VRLPRKEHLIRVLLAGVVFLSFFLGAVSSLHTTKGGRSWVLAARDRVVSHIPNVPFVSKDSVKGLLGQSDPIFPSPIDTLRYRLVTVKRFSIKGQFQLAQDSQGSVYAVDRNVGDFYKLKSDSQSSQVILSNLFSAIDNLEGKSSRAFRITDLHYFNSKFYVNSVLITNKGQSECGAAYSFEMKKNKITSFSRFLKTPCIEDRKNPAMWGGRFTNTNSALYLSIGEQRYDRSGFPKLSDVATVERANPNSIFGCVLEFKVPIGLYSRFSCGHRNAQGLYYSVKDNLLFESEHGPMGGDEVNLLARGRNYGWPNVSLGSAYGWPLAGPESEKKKIDFDVSATNTKYEKQLKTYGFIRGSHKGFAPPLMSWIPSVGASAILQIPENPVFRDWSSDLILGTMAETSMHRIRISDGRVILDERIPLGFRIRDMLIGQNNLLYIATDEDQLVAIKFIPKN
jgi:hypothetical protein